MFKGIMSNLVKTGS